MRRVLALAGSEIACLSMPSLTRARGIPSNSHTRRASRLHSQMLRGSETRFGVPCGQSGGNVVLVGESAEDLLPADPVHGEVDWFRRMGVGLSRGELAEGTVRPGLGVPMILSQIAFALGACGGLARILMPSAVSTASKELVNWPARSLIRNLTKAARWPRSISMFRAACVHVDEVNGENAAGLGCQELPPGRAAAAGRRIDPRVMQDLPHRGRRDRVAEL